MERFLPNWLERRNIEGGIRYVCGYCGTDTTPAYGWYSDSSGLEPLRGFVLICTNCNRPSFIERLGLTIASTTPRAKMGKEIRGLPTDVSALYEEARGTTSAGAYTAAVLTCRKILMHVAVEKGASENKPFIEYVDYLAEKGYVPPNGREWVDYIRSKSNDANHEILMMSPQDAEDLVTFTEMLLRLVYEFRERLPKPVSATDEQQAEN